MASLAEEHRVSGGVAEEHWVVTANTLADGGVVYLTPARVWSADLQQAWFGPRAAAESVREWAKAQEEGVICDPYVFALDRVEGYLVPRTARERIRAEGPLPTLARLGYAPAAPAPQRRAV